MIWLVFLFFDADPMMTVGVLIRARCSLRSFRQPSPSTSYPPSLHIPPPPNPALPHSHLLSSCPPPPPNPPLPCLPHCTPSTLSVVSLPECQVEYRRHQDNLGAVNGRGEGGGGFPAQSPGFGPRGGPPGAGGAWTRNRGGPRGLGPGGDRGDDHHKVKKTMRCTRVLYLSFK